VTKNWNNLNLKKIKINKTRNKNLNKSKELRREKKNIKK
jgi:hypothetical protein